MKSFTLLIKDLELTNSTIKKIALLSTYFENEKNEKNRLWAIAIFTGKKPPRMVNTTLLRLWSAELAGIPLWLFEQNYHIVGDLAETISLIVPKNIKQIEIGLNELIDQMQLYKKESDDVKKNYIIEMWQSLDKDQLWVFNKLITGGFRIGVSKNIIIQALSNVTGFESSYIAYLLMGDWSPNKIKWSYFAEASNTNSDHSKPYPFFLAYPLSDVEFEKLTLDEWVVEWKWDGIRGQLIKRTGQIFLWSRGEELITDKFPEFNSAINIVEDFVLDGEILAWKNDMPMDFQYLQTRIGRKNPSKKILSDVPAMFLAYDILEVNHQDIRQLPFEKRREILEKLVQSKVVESIGLSPIIVIENKSDLHTKRNESSHYYAEGLMLKRKKGIYHTGRKSGDMWKWKKEPYTIDAVMIYAQRGHGRRANLFSDFTFALKDGDRLLPFAKAYSGLTDIEMKEITEFVKKNTIETFGPVSSVRAELVFELAFEGISLSTRHKSGIAVRFPRISRWRKDKTVDDIDSLDSLKELIKK
jgi:DNA ligase-1